MSNRIVDPADLLMMIRIARYGSVENAERVENEHNTQRYWEEIATQIKLRNSLQVCFGGDAMSLRRGLESLMVQLDDAERQDVELYEAHPDDYEDWSSEKLSPAEEELVSAWEREYPGMFEFGQETSKAMFEIGA